MYAEVTDENNNGREIKYEIYYFPLNFHEPLWPVIKTGVINLASRRICICYIAGITNLLTTWSRVPPEKLTSSQLDENFPSFYQPQKFIIALTRAGHLSLSSARSMQSIPPIPLPEIPSYFYPPIYTWIFQVVSFFQVSSPKFSMHLSFPSYVLRAPPVSFLWIWSPG